MKLKNKILFIISFAPTIITAISLFFMNDIVPTHYNINGDIDRWGSKYENFIFPAIIIAFYLFWIIYIKFYSASNTDNIEKAKININVLYIIAILITSALGVLQCIFLVMAFIKSENLSFNIDIFFIMNCILSIVYIFIGNFLPKTKHNQITGVRTSWTQKSDKNWYVANRNAGIAFVVAGILSIIESSIIGGILSTLIMMVILLISFIISYIYSYITVTKKSK